jgi:NADPH:quinone reductase-like Zn-dependent oxidoreductase
MGLSRRKFTREFKLAAVRRLEAGVSLAEVARALEVNPNVLHRWGREFRQAPGNAFPGNGQPRWSEGRAAELERKVIATSSSDEKLNRMRELGARAGINYKSHPDWDEYVLRETEGLGVDHVVEVGGPSTLEKSLRAVRIGGTISLIGALAGVEAVVNPLPVLLKAVRLQGISVGPRDSLEQMHRAIGQYGLRPVVDRVFPFEQAHEALHYLESGKHFGKIVIRI